MTFTDGFVRGYILAIACGGVGLCAALAFLGCSRPRATFGSGQPGIQVLMDYVPSRHSDGGQPTDAGWPK